MLTFLMLRSSASALTGLRSVCDSNERRTWRDIQLNYGQLNLTVDSVASQFYSYGIDELRRLNHSTLHKILLSPALELTSEDALVDTLIEIDDCNIEVWETIEFQFVSNDGIQRIANYDRLRQQMSQTIWHQWSEDSRKPDRPLLRLRRFCIVPDSRILQ